MRLITLMLSLFHSHGMLLVTPVFFLLGHVQMHTVKIWRCGFKWQGGFLHKWPQIAAFAECRVLSSFWLSFLFQRSLLPVVKDRMENNFLLLSPKGSGIMPSLHFLFWSWWEHLSYGNLEDKVLLLQQSYTVYTQWSVASWRDFPITMKQKPFTKSYCWSDLKQ